MKKKLLPLAMLAGFAGAVSTAQAVHLNADGLGQALIYPYYTVEGDQDTYISVVNTTNEAKAIKVRFLEGENSQEVLDFNLYLSPFDHWSAVITSAYVLEATPGGPITVVEEGTSGAELGAVLKTWDNSCTVPNISNLEDGVPFVNYAYKWVASGGTFELSGDTNQGLNRTREGYVEVIEMGTMGFWDGSAMVEYDGNGQLGSGAAGYSKHSASGVPANCAALVAAWEETASGAPIGDWANDNNLNMAGPSGGLYGYGVLISPVNGTNATYSAVAVDNFREDELHTSPGSVLPSLAQADEFSDVIDGADVWAADFVTSARGGVDAVSSVLMRASLANDYVLDEVLNAATDWVVTFPTKRFYVAEPVQEDRQPFTAAWSGSTACEQINLQYWDREELQPTTPPEGTQVPFSPRPPQFEDIPDGFNFCTEVSIMTFNGHSALNSSERLTYNLNLADGFENGWARIDFTNPVPPGGDPADYNDRSIVDDSGITFRGLPVVGFAVQKYENNTLNGVLSNFAGLIEHKYTRDIFVSD